MTFKLVAAGVAIVGTALAAVPAAAASIVRAQVRAAAVVELASGSAVPQPGIGGRELRGVRCVSRADCWAVGSFGTRAMMRNEALRWNGRRWSLVGTPSPGSMVSLLESVSCTSAANCWAVGWIENGSSDNPTVLNQALHWNGRSWSTVPTPDPGGTAPGDASQLHAVTCPAPASCWAVGAVLQNFAAPTNQVLHWDGRAWSQVFVPAPGSFSSLAGARCLAAADCWAVGDTSGPAGTHDQALHWDGHTWSLVPTPGHRPSSRASGLSGVRCTSRASCWAVGSRGSGRRLLNEALHWDGHFWSRVPAPNPGRTSKTVRNALTAVSCTFRANCWAVGSHQFSVGTGAPAKNQALHWNGRRWSRVFTPNPGGAAKFANTHLNDVACTTPADCWAVGSSRRPPHTARNQILHWNGIRWSKA